MAFDLSQHAPRLAALARRGVWLGSSSWIYQGWRGQVYFGDYSGARKGFVKARFEKQCLEEVSRVFPTVCFDGAYWRFPTHEQLRKYYDQTPQDFRLALKVTDLITIRQFRDARDMGVKRGQMNSTYLDWQAFEEFFLKPAREALAEKLGPIIFEFSAFHFGKPFGPNDGYSPLDFVRDLHVFLSRLPKNVWWAVEIRDPELLDPAFGRYLDCLRYHGVAHVLNEQTWMPPIEQQLEIPGIFTAKHSVVRALVRPGISHEAAVREFSPYDHTQVMLPEMRQALADLSRLTMDEDRQLFAYVNNRAEGNAPNTLAAILDLLDAGEPPKAP